MKWGILVIAVLLTLGCISDYIATEKIAEDVGKVKAEAGEAGEQAKEAGKELAGRLEQRAAELGIPVGDDEWSKEVFFSTDDGVGIQGTFYFADEPGYTVILVHMLGANRGDWAVFAPKLVELGYEVLAIDLRGHGGSTNLGSWKGFEEGDFLRMNEDVEAAIGFLGETKVAIIGASIGANVALNYAAEDSGILAIILMSPGEEYQGVETLGAMEEYGERPVLFMVSEEDSYSAISANKLYPVATGEKELKMYKGSRHGTKLLGDSAIEADIFNWLGKNFKGE